MQAVRIDRIQIGQRVRGAGSADVAALARSIELEGLIHPIMVRQLKDGTVRLVAGLHRLDAFKFLKRIDIPCVWMALTGDDAIDDCTQDIIECDENLARAGLDEGMRALFTSKRTLATVRRSGIRKRAAATERMEQARAATKAAKDKAAKEKARAEYQNAHKSLEKLSAGLAAPEANLADKLPAGALDEVAAEMGVSRTTVKSDLATVRTFGEEVLKLAASLQLHVDGTGPRPNYTTRGELSALKTLKDEHPSRYEEVVNSWRTSVETKKPGAKRPTLVLADLAMREADRKKQASRNTVLGGLERAQQEVAKANSALADAYSSFASLKSLGLNTKNVPSDIRAMREKLDLIRRLLADLKQAQKELSAD